jgi:hypothetical protein
MAITFPSSPNVGDTFTSNGRSWQWDGTAWTGYGNLPDPSVFAVDATNDAVSVYGDLSVGASAQITGDLTVDTDTFHADTTNNRVGIGTTTPRTPLEIQGTSSGSVDEVLLLAADGNQVAGSGARLHLSGGNATQRSAYIEGVNTSGMTNAHALTFGTSTDASDPVERMRIDSSGNVGIGTTSPGQALEVSGRIYATGISGNAFPLELNTNTTSCRILMKDANSTSAAIIGSEGDDLIMRTNGTERVRVDVDGKLILSGGSISTSIPGGVVSAGDANGLFLYAKTGNGTARLGMWIDGDGGGGDLPFVVADTSSSPQCVIYGDGDLANVNNDYGMYSDVSLKQDIVDANPQWDDIKAVQLRNFRLIADVEENGDDALVHLGVVAQELESAGMAGLVKTFDGQPKRVKASILYMKAIGALQEAMARIETLEVQNDAFVARIEALEAN